MSSIGRILYSKECEATIKEHWPDVCPECGCVAWTGPILIRCVNEKCRHGSPKESSDYQELLENDAKAHPGNQFDSEDTFYPYKQHFVFDLRDYVENSNPTHTNTADTEWTYQLPVGGARNHMIGDWFESSGTRYCICKLDRTTDELTIMQDPRV